MPAAYVEKIAKDRGISVKDAESRWDTAKQKAVDAGLSPDKDSSRYWSYVMGVFKRMMGVEESYVSMFLAKLKDIN